MPEKNLEIIPSRDESISPTGFSTTPENSTNTTISHDKQDQGKELPHIDEVDEGDVDSTTNNDYQVLVSSVTPKHDRPHKNLLSHS